ncbi:hypothetical protein ACFQVA_15855 [Actinomadura keratinilytica]
MWERFSFLGMQAILVLFFADTVAGGGMGMDPGTAASVSAAYGTMVYLVSVAAAGSPTACSARTGRCCGAASSSRSATTPWRSPPTP